MLVASFILHKRKKSLMFVFLFLSLLGRGETISIILILSFHAILVQKRIRLFIACFAPTLPYYLVFKPWLEQRTGLDYQALGGTSNYFSIPFKTVIVQFNEFLEKGDYVHLILMIVGVCFLLSILTFVIFRIIFKRDFSFENLIIASFFGLVFTLENVAWSNPIVQLTRVLGFCFPCLVYLMIKNEQYRPFALGPY